MARKPVIGIDPGETTGIAYWISDDVWGHIQSPADSVTHHLDWLTRRYRIRNLVIERDDQRSIHLNPISFEVIGRIKEFASGVTNCNLTFQTPAMAKYFFTDARLKERGFYQAGMPHANDGWRHILRFWGEFVSPATVEKARQHETAISRSRSARQLHDGADTSHPVGKKRRSPADKS